MKSILLSISLSLGAMYSSQTLTVEYRNDAGAPSTQSGFFQANNPINFPTGAYGWWHLLDLRHSSNANNHAMQLAGSYSDPGLWFRKIANGSVQNSDTSPWSKVVLENPSGNVGIGIDTPQAKLDVNGSVRINNSNSQYTSLTLGRESNDQIIVDNTPAKSYGGGYFFRVHNSNISSGYTDAVIIGENGNVGIGKSSPENKLDVNGTIHAKEVKVDLTGWADYVFKNDYALPTLEDVERHILEHGHLPDVPSEKEVLKNGVNLGDNQRLLLQKIEELTLYSIEQNKQIRTLLERIDKLEQSK